jgi:hypothetical protein
MRTLCAPYARLMSALFFCFQKWSLVTFCHALLWLPVMRCYGFLLCVYVVMASCYAFLRLPVMRCCGFLLCVVMASLGFCMSLGFDDAMRLFLLSQVRGPGRPGRAGIGPRGQPGISEAAPGLAFRKSSRSYSRAAGAQAGPKRAPA